MQAIAQYTTKIFKSGNSMAVRIPKNIDVKDYLEAIIYQSGNAIIIEPKITKKTKWDTLFSELSSIDSDEILVSKLPLTTRTKYFD